MVEESRLGAHISVSITSWGGGKGLRHIVDLLMLLQSLASAVLKGNNKPLIPTLMPEYRNSVGHCLWSLS